MPRQKSWSSWCSNSCHVGGNSLWPTSQKKKKDHSFCFFWKGLRLQQLFCVTIYKWKRGGGSFFLSPKNNKAVIHFCPRVISWDESPWEPWQLPLFSFLPGQRAFPQGKCHSHSAKLQEYSPAQNAPYVGPQVSSLTLSTGKRKHISTEPFPELCGVLLWGGVLSGRQIETFGTFELDFSTRLPIAKVLSLTNM